MTWDDLGKTYYSLKRGGEWKASVRKDVGYGGCLTGRTREKDKSPPKPKSSDARALVELPPAAVLDWIADDEARGASATALINPHGEALPELARELLQRFGDEGPAAEALAARAFSTPRAVGSLLDFRHRQLANAERWANDETAPVRRWAERVAQWLRERIAEDEAHATFRRKLG